MRVIFSSQLRTGTLALAVSALVLACEGPTGKDRGSSTGPSPKDLSGTPQDDKFAGKGADDSIHGGGGDDFLRGSEGDDTILGELGNDKLKGGGGNDHLDGGPGDDQLGGGDGDDTLLGGPGNDRLHGGPGEDRMEGNEGNDVLRGEEGRDLMIGGPGADVFEFKRRKGTSIDAWPSRQSDVIEDFSLEEGDVLDLTDILLEGGYIGDGSVGSFEGFLRLNGTMFQVDPKGNGDFADLVELKPAGSPPTLEKIVEMGGIVIR